MAGAHPEEVDRWEGHLPRRDAHEAEAMHALTRSRVPWPRARTLVGVSPYRARFRDGATRYPRRFFIVEPEPIGRLGGRRDAPRMRGQAGSLDKHPWSSVTAPSGPVEIQFLRRIALGETIAPFRVLDMAVAVVPLDGLKLLDSAAASEAGYRYLSAWLRDIESKWAEHSKRDADGHSRTNLSDNIDHMRKLSGQVGQPAMRVLYTASGTRLSAVTMVSNDTLVYHGAYWAAARSANEAAYLLAVINSSAVLAKITDLQAHGQRDKRHFDNLVWTLPIPEYDDTDTLHRDLAAAAAHAETIAAAVELTDSQHFTAKRRAIRAALVADGVAAEMEALVDALLPP